MIGGIDLGGTKIEARLFGGPGGTARAVRRVPTPTDSFARMVEALQDQIAWLDSEAGDPALPVGVAVPGVVDPATGALGAANIPSDGSSLQAALEARARRPVPVVNDGLAFALSEARGGEGDGAPGCVVGLVFGTGLGGGVATGGALPPRAHGLGVEIGHVGLPARALLRHGLPLWTCGCGKTGCLESYLSGPGLRALGRWRTGHPMSGPEIAAGHPDGEAVLDLWADLAGDGLQAAVLAFDPDEIVLGGGLSNLPGIDRRLAAALERHALLGVRPPRVRLARHGDASGARGAAILAADAAGRDAPC